VPYIVAGAGGYANKQALLHKIEKASNGKALDPGFQTTHQDLKLMAFNDQEPGFLRVTVDGKKQTVIFDYFVVPFPPASPSGSSGDTVTVPW